MTMQRTAGFVAGLVVAALLGAGFLDGRDNSAVDWSAMRAVAFESDDWGLPGFVPGAGAWAGIDREALAPGRFPAVYWESTLEDSAQVAELAAVLASVRGRDGLPAVLQPNYILGSWGYEEGRWRRYSLPDAPAAYDRPGMWRAVGEARRKGVWHPELHGFFHYDVDMRRERALEPGAAREATLRGILLFPGSEQARELGPWRIGEGLVTDFHEARALFGRIFGVEPRSVIAPDYTWNGRVEGIWERVGLAVIQGKREQRNPDLPRGSGGRILKLLERRLARLVHPGRRYLERNARFEPVQFPEPAAVGRSCLEEIRAAWREGEPAIVETHRVNFAHVDPGVTATGRHELGALLSALEPAGPVFLVDHEIDQLADVGVSVRVVPDRGVVLRNGTRSRKVAALPGRPGQERARLVLLSPGANLLWEPR